MFCRYELHRDLHAAWRLPSLLPYHVGRGGAALASASAGDLGHGDMGFRGLPHVQEENLRRHIIIFQ